MNKASCIDDVSLSFLANIYQGKKKKWKNGEKIIVINLPITSPYRRKFYQVVLHSKPTKQFFDPGSPIPLKTKVVKFESSVLKFVSRIPNAIGYISLNAVDESVKILTIDNVKYDEKLYKLNNHSE